MNKDEKNRTVSCGCWRKSKEHPMNKRDTWETDPRGRLIAQARERAKRKGLEFSISKKDLIVPEFCPLLGIKIDPLAKDRTTSPSLDRINSSLGYVPENVWVISSRANTLKNNGTKEEFRLILENWKE